MSKMLMSGGTYPCCVHCWKNGDKDPVRLRQIKRSINQEVDEDIYTEYEYYKDLDNFYWKEYSDSDYWEQKLQMYPMD